jgi:hypothetical protein
MSIELNDLLEIYYLIKQIFQDNDGFHQLEISKNYENVKYLSYMEVYINEEDRRR